MFRPLIITEGTRAAIRAVIAHAEAHRIPLWRMRRMVERKEVVPTAFDREFFVEIDDGYGVVLTIEEHPAGWIRHLSIRVRTPGKYPNPRAVLAILEEFGITTPLNQCRRYTTSGARGNVGDSVDLLIPGLYAAPFPVA